MQETRIPNDATYSPIALTDVMLAAPIVSRLLLGATLPGRVIQMAAMGAYAASALQDWFARQGIQKIDFLREFGADVHHLDEMPVEVRERDVRLLGERVNDGFTTQRIPRDELVREIDGYLTDYIADITGHRVITSTEIRGFGVAQLVFPFALGTCDVLTGDIAIFRDTGVFEPHVIAHELCHRKGYFKELEAQALAYLALVDTGEPVLVQSALCERLHRNIRVLADEDDNRFAEIVRQARLRPELSEHFLKLRPGSGPMLGAFSSAMRRIYDERMKLTGQNGLSDYDRGFTNFLYTFERAPSARQAAPAPVAAAGA